MLTRSCTPASSAHLCVLFCTSKLFSYINFVFNALFRIFFSFLLNSPQVAKRKPLNKLVYTLLSDKKLKEMMKKHGLSIKGDRRVIAHSPAVFTTMHCTAPRYSALHCSAPLCNALYCIALHCPILLCTALHCPTLLCTALHCPTLLYTALHCSALSYITLHCPTLLRTVLTTFLYRCETWTVQTCTETEPFLPNLFA